MEAIRVEELCAELGAEREKLDVLRKKLGIKCAKRDNVWTITQEEANVIRKEWDLPEQLKSETYWATGIHNAQNPRWIWCKIDGLPNKHPVLIPPRFYGRLERKRFPVEKIEDVNGVTWRHEWFAKLDSYA